MRKKYIEKIHSIFDELGLTAKEFDDIEKLLKTVSRTIALTKDIDSARKAIAMLLYIMKKSRKIDRIFNRHKDYRDSLKNGGREEIDIYDDEEYAYGNYIFVNSIFKKDYGIMVFSILLDNDNPSFIPYDKKKKRYSINDKDFYLQYSKRNINKMNILSGDKKIATLSLDEGSLGASLIDNKSPFEIVNDDGLLWIIKKNTIREKGEEIASIEWDLIAKNSEYSLSYLEVYKDLNGEDMTILFAISIGVFLIYQSEIQNLRMAELALASFISSRI
jgi:hypothetical protein